MIFTRSPPSIALASTHLFETHAKPKAQTRLPAPHAGDASVAQFPGSPPRGERSSFFASSAPFHAETYETSRDASRGMNAGTIDAAAAPASRLNSNLPLTSNSHARCAASSGSDAAILRPRSVTINEFIFIASAASSSPRRAIAEDAPSAGAGADAAAPKTRSTCTSASASSP